MATRTVGSVDQYIRKQPRAAQAVLTRVRDIIRKTVPTAEEGISYRIPVYKIRGELVVFFAGWRDHFSLYPAIDGLREAFAAELQPYDVSKGTIRFPLSEPVPVRLIQRLVKFRAKVSVERARQKAERAKVKRTTRRAASVKARR